jgi:diadenosine tetraphosphate (Ap4A) HIT family hydrolase
MFPVLFLALLAVDCPCDPQIPATMAERQCSLCGVAEKQPADVRVFILKDNNPRKPARWLALPRTHGAAAHHLHEMTPAARTELWNAAVAKAKETFGEEWGVAYNGEQVRTQCHTHIHIGRFNPVAEQSKGFLVVSQASEIPAPPGVGIWVHPVKGKWHVHTGEQVAETVLVR